MTQIGRIFSYSSRPRGLCSLAGSQRRTGGHTSYFEPKGLENLVKVQDNVVSLTEAHENMRVVSVVISRRAPLTLGSTLPILIG